MNRGHIEHSIQTRTAPGSASVVQYEQSKLLPWVLVCSILSGLAIGLCLLTVLLSQQAERESRMLQYYVLEMDAKLIAAGVKKPDEAISKRLEK
jgi:ABC-type taurine transport system ATPase subunit